MPRYSTDKTTANEPTNCEIALTASQFIPVLYHSVNGRSLLRLVGNFENDFAARVTGSDLFLRLRGVCEWERLRDDYLDLVFVDQFTDLSEVI